MRDFRLARVFGFEVRIDASWFVIFFLVLWSFTAAVFPQRAPGLGMAAHVAMGIAGALLFFVTLLAHEIAHSVVARAKGIPVDGITLFVFGGVARTRSEAKSPGDEFLIAGVGPLASFAIAIAFQGIANLMARSGATGAASVVLAYVAVLNYALAIFNLLPGFPLDGGRLLRAIVWKATGNLRRATRIASTGGRWLGYLLMAIGLLFAFQGNIVGGLWFVLIGWFLRNTAAASYQEHLVSDLLSGVRAAQVMTPYPISVPPALSLQRFFDEHVRHTRFVAFPVIDGDAPLGIVTIHALRDVPRDRWPDMTVGDVVTAIGPEMIAHPDDPVPAIMAQLQASPVRRLLVLRDGRVAGIITARDVANWLDKARQIEGMSRNG
ncbi:MAG: site-2 protease family protein [Longimicrobiales bacterium]